MTNHGLDIRPPAGALAPLLYFIVGLPPGSRRWDEYLGARDPFAAPVATVHHRGRQTFTSGVLLHLLQSWGKRIAVIGFTVKLLMPRKMPDSAIRATETFQPNSY